MPRQNSKEGKLLQRQDHRRYYTEHRDEVLYRNRQNRLLHRREYLDKDRQRYRARTAFLNDLKLSRGCADCGYNAHPAALHFDHLPGNVKVGNISELRNLAWKTLLDEIAKCEVVCANCHAVRTESRPEQRRGRPPVVSEQKHLQLRFES